jgi:hypothetical protein
MPKYYNVGDTAYPFIPPKGTPLTDRPPPPVPHGTPIFKRHATASPDPPTLRNLSNLEDAIFEDSPALRLKFFTIYKELDKINEDKYDDYLIKHSERWKRTLTHCWFLGWRSDPSNTRVRNAN